MLETWGWEWKINLVHGDEQDAFVFSYFSCCPFLPCGTCMLCSEGVQMLQKQYKVMLVYSQVLKAVHLQVTIEFAPALHIRNATQVCVLSLNK